LSNAKEGRTSAGGGVAGGKEEAVMSEIIACPDATCGAPARIVDRWTFGSTSGAVEHVKTTCERGHWFTPTVDMLRPLGEKVAVSSGARP
jgi:hypothetical protein